MNRLLFASLFTLSTLTTFIFGLATAVRGKHVSFTGQVIGRGMPGYIFGEDMMYQDKTRLIFLDYNSAFGSLGNFFFALSKIKELYGIPSEAAS